MRSVTLKSLRRNIGVAFEDSFLFSDTVRANIAYGRPDATDAEIEAAATAAQAHEFVSGCPTGTTLSSASGASRCPVASGNASRWHGRSWPTPRS